MIPHPSTPPPSEEALAELEELRTENRRARQEQIVASAASVEATRRYGAGSGSCAGVISRTSL